ncbi:MAG TPA: sugar transferase [Gemmatimonadaceae bacterium]
MQHRVQQGSLRRGTAGSSALTEQIVSVARGTADLLAVLAAFAVSCFLYAWFIRAGWIPGDPPRFVPYLTIALAFSGIALLVFAHLGLYRRSASVLNLAELQTAAEGIALAAAYLFAFLFFLKLRGYSRIAIVGAIGAAIVLVILERRLMAAILGKLQLRGRLGRRVVILGTGATGRLVMKKIVQAPHIGYHVVGFIDDVLPIGTLVSCRIAQMGPVLFQAPVLGRWKDWHDVVVQYEVDDLLMTAASATADRLRELIQLTSAGRLRVGVVPHLEAIRPDQLQVDDLSAIPVLRPSSATPTRFYTFAKRLIDLVVGTGLVVLTTPLWLLAAVAVALESPGPCLFVQERVGLDGRRFRMFKFRTMWRDAARYARSPRGDVDPRITRVGRILRMSGLDELPQLLNVLRGEMSLVGPRPEMPFIVERYSPLEWQRLRAKPGITGLWQLSADRHAEIHENIEYDLYYIDHRSVMMDVLILLETLFFTIGLALSAPRRYSAADYRPATVSPDDPRADERHVLVALDQRGCGAGSGDAVPPAWRRYVPAACALADRWPIKMMVAAPNVPRLDRLLDASMRHARSGDRRIEYTWHSSGDELRALVAGACLVITDLPHVTAVAAEVGVDHLCLERGGARAVVRTSPAREILRVLDPLFRNATAAPIAPHRERLVPFDTDRRTEEMNTAM